MNHQVLNVRLVNNNVLGSVDDAAGTPTVIGLLKQTYNKLNTSTGNTSLNLTILQNRVNSLENTVNGSEEANPPIEGLTARVSDLEDVTDDQTENIRLNADNISDVSQRLTNLNASLNSINTNLTDSIRTINTNLSALSDRVTNVDKIDSNTVNPDHGRLKIVENQVDTLNNSVANLVAEVEGTGGALDDIIDLQADVTTLQNTVQGIHPGVGESTNNLGGERFNLYGNGDPVRNQASGDYSHAEGYLTIASGNYSHVEGSSNEASAESSHAEGSMAKATGIASHAEGYLTQASGNYAHAEGYTNSITYYTASGQGSHTEGFNTRATNTACHAEGEYTTASGLYAHAEGYYATADGNYSHAGGWGTRAKGGCMTAIGRFNTFNSNDSTNSINRLLIVGNGGGETTRSDAFVVKYDGSVIINSTRSGSTPSLTIGPTSKAITGTTATSSSTENDDSIIATKYYVDHFLGIYPEYVEISIPFYRKPSSGSWTPIDTLILKANIQTLSNNYKLINGVAYNIGTGTYNINTGDYLCFGSKFTINETQYYFRPPSDLAAGFFVLNLPVSQLIFGYLNFYSANNSYWFCQRYAIYQATSNISFTGKMKVWLQIINLYGTFTPIE